MYIASIGDYFENNKINFENLNLAYYLQFLDTLLSQGI